jgi:Fe-Mn family superoxide dismutase
MHPMIRTTVATLAAIMLTACAQTAVRAPVEASPAAPQATAPSAAQAFPQAPLPYASDALEPVIDKATMEIHFGRHHKAYHDALNNFAAANPELARLTLQDILAKISLRPAVVRNNAGGIWNHAFFWQTMAPAGQRGAPSPALLSRINADFGSLDNLQKQFNQAGATRFGSGWTWLVVKDGKLFVSSTPNQDNPLMDVAEVRGTPILGNDVWEHAYYLKYQNRRADYLAAWWQVVNWNEVNKRFAASL